MTDKSQSIENLVNMAVGGHLEFVQKVILMREIILEGQHKLKSTYHINLCDKGQISHN